MARRVDLSRDAVREITVGVGSAIKRSGLPYEERELARKAALETLIPLAEVGTVEDVRRAISHLKLLTDPDGATQAAMDAFDDQSLTVEQVGSMSKLTAWLTHENAAALMTVLTQRVDGMRRTGELAEEEQLAPEIDPETFTGRRIAGEKHRHLLAVAFGDLVTGLLDDNAVGSHHGIAPHVTVTVDLARFEAGLGADLTMPGTDTPVLLANESVRRILCDCDLTTVITRPLTLAAPQTPTRATSRSPTCSSTPPVRSSTSGAPNASSHPGCAARSRPATGTAPSPAAAPTCAAATPTTSTSGSTAAPPTSTTQSSSASATTTPSTKAAGASPAATGVPPGGTGAWQFTPPERRHRP